MLLFYIRHGEPIYSPDSLTKHGEKQAEALAKRLALYGIDEIYASSSARAVATSTPTAQLLQKQIHILDWCHEDYAWQQLTLQNADGTPQKWLFQDGESSKKLVEPQTYALGDRWYERDCFNQKRFKDGILRVQTNAYAFLESLGYVHDPARNLYTAAKPNDKKIALFAHEGFGLAFLSAVLDIPYPLFCTRFAIEHSTMTVIRFECVEGVNEVIPCVLQLSNDSHLYKENILTGYNGGKDKF